MPVSLQKLVILHTNDIHSHFEQMPRIASLIRSRRAAHAEDALGVVTVDCGDHMDRMFMETEGTAGKANIAVMNATGYDAAVLGNNEGLTFPAGTLAAAYNGEARFALLGSNIAERQSGLTPEWFAPYRIIACGPVRLGLIGITASFNDFYHPLGWDVGEPLAAAARMVRQLRGKADAIVLLSHLGLSTDERIAREVEGIDVILGGHTHHLLEQPLRVGDTYLCAAGKFGRYVGEVELLFDGERRRLHEVRGRCLETSEYQASDDIAALIAEWQAVASGNLGEEVATLSEPLHNDWSHESQLGNLLAAGLRRWTGAEASLVNAGQLLDGLAAGPVTRETLLRLCPSPINPCLLTLRGDQIAQALEEALLPEFQTKPLMGYGFRGKVLGTLCLDGIEVRFDPDAEPYAMLRSVSIGGGELRPDAVYEIATLDMFTFGVGYPTLGKGSGIRYFLPEFIRDVLAAELQDAEALIDCARPRWTAQRS